MGANGVMLMPGNYSYKKGILSVFLLTQFLDKILTSVGCFQISINLLSTNFK